MLEALMGKGASLFPDPFLFRVPTLRAKPGRGRLRCAGPNCGRTFDRIKTVWIWGVKTRLYRIAENFGEVGVDGADLMAVDISAVSLQTAPIVFDVRDRCDRFATRIRATELAR